jgi:hypothetical protein
MKVFRRGDVVVCWGSKRKKAVVDEDEEGGNLGLEWFDNIGRLRRSTVRVGQVAQHFITDFCDSCRHRIGDHPNGPCEKCDCRRYEEG